MADFAAERSFVGVGHLVTHERPFMGKTSIADFAHIWLFPCVNAHMCIQGGLAGEVFAAHAAHERFVATVNESLVPM